MAVMPCRAGILDGNVDLRKVWVAIRALIWAWEQGPSNSV